MFAHSSLLSPLTPRQTPERTARFVVVTTTSSAVGATARASVELDVAIVPPPASWSVQNATATLRSRAEPVPGSASTGTRTHPRTAARCARDLEDRSAPSERAARREMFPVHSVRVERTRFIRSSAAPALDQEDSRVRAPHQRPSAASAREPESRRAASAQDPIPLKCLATTADSSDFEPALRRAVSRGFSGVPSAVAAASRSPWPSRLTAPTARDAGELRAAHATVGARSNASPHKQSPARDATTMASRNVVLAPIGLQTKEKLQKRKKDRPIVVLHRRQMESSVLSASRCEASSHSMLHLTCSFPLGARRFSGTPRICQ